MLKSENSEIVGRGVMVGCGRQGVVGGVSLSPPPPHPTTTRLPLYLLF